MQSNDIASDERDWIRRDMRGNLMRKAGGEAECSMDLANPGHRLPATDVVQHN